MRIQYCDTTGDTLNSIRMILFSFQRIDILVNTVYIKGARNQIRFMSPVIVITNTFPGEQVQVQRVHTT